MTELILMAEGSNMIEREMFLQRQQKVLNSHLYSLYANKSMKIQKEGGVKIGRRLSSGIYFQRERAKETTEGKKERGEKQTIYSRLSQ